MTSPSTQKLKIFLCYAREDEDTVSVLCEQLKAFGFDPWIDKDMPPGVNWEPIVEKEINQETDAAIICISNILEDKIGYMQREIKMILKKADQYPDDDCFLIPVKLNDCTVPYQLTRFNYINLFGPDGFHSLMKALERRALRAGAQIIKYDEATFTRAMTIKLIHNSTSSNGARYLRMLCKSIQEGKVEPQVLAQFNHHPYFLVRKLAIEAIIEANTSNTLELLYQFRDTSYHVSQTLIREYIKNRAEGISSQNDEIIKMMDILFDLSKAKKVTDISKKKNIRLLNSLREKYNIP